MFCWWGSAELCLKERGHASSLTLLPEGEGNNESLRNWNPLWPAGFYPTVSSISHDVVTKATLSIAAFLRDSHLVGRKEGHGEFCNSSYHREQTSRRYRR